MQTIITLTVFFLIWPAAALGHDYYIYTEGMVETFQFAQIGWIWKTYHVQSLDSLYFALADSQPMIWNAFINPLLAQPALYVASAPLVIYWSIVLIMWIGGYGTFEGEGLADKFRR